MVLLSGAVWHQVQPWRHGHSRGFYTVIDCHSFIGSFKNKVIPGYTRCGHGATRLVPSASRSPPSCTDATGRGATEDQKSNDMGKYFV